MIPLTVTAAVALLPVLLGLIFRVHAFHVFASIGSGYLLQFALSDDVDLAMATVVQGSNAIIAAQLVLLFLPVLLTLFFLRRTQGKSFVFQFVPLIFSGLLLATLFLPLTTPAFIEAVHGSEYGTGIKGAQDLIIAGAVISNLLGMLFKAPKSHGKHH